MRSGGALPALWLRRAFFLCDEEAFLAGLLRLRLRLLLRFFGAALRLFDLDRGLRLRDRRDCDRRRERCERRDRDRGGDFRRVRERRGGSGVRRGERRRLLRLLGLCRRLGLRLRRGRLRLRLGKRRGVFARCGLSGTLLRLLRLLRLRFAGLRFAGLRGDSLVRSAFLSLAISFFSLSFKESAFLPFSFFSLEGSSEGTFFAFLGETSFSFTFFVSFTLGASLLTSFDLFFRDFSTGFADFFSPLEDVFFFFFLVSFISTESSASSVCTYPSSWSSG